MSGLLDKVKSMLGGAPGGVQGASQQEGGFDSDKALSFTTERWSKLKNAYIVYHQAVWESFLFDANQTW